MAENDRAAEIMAAWQRERPDLDSSSIGIVTRLWHLSRIFGAQRRKLLADLGIEPALIDLLGTLRRSGSPYAVSTRDLAERAAITPAAISQRLSRAERRGWVTREPVGRQVLVRLTSAGQQVADETAGAIFAEDERLLAAIDPGQREALAAALQELCLALAGGLPPGHVGGDDIG